MKVTIFIYLITCAKNIQVRAYESKVSIIIKKVSLHFRNKGFKNKTEKLA